MSAHIPNFLLVKDTIETRKYKKKKIGKTSIEKLPERARGD